jgi:hypothetical protein
MLQSDPFVNFLSDTNPSKSYSALDRIRFHPRTCFKLNNN